MNSILVATHTVRRTVQANREKHKTEYEEARANFVEARAAKLKELASVDPASDSAVSAAQTAIYRLAQPTCHLKEYDRVIDMLEFHSSDTISISAEQFSKYMKDEWDWKAQFDSTYNSYKGSKA